MARPLRIEFPGALYLVTARAMSRQKLFRDDEEAADFEGRLPGLAEAFGAVFHGFCLLPSHYHLLLETPRGNVSRVLHRLNSGYTATVNASRRRSGPIFQTRYRSIVLEEDPWLLRLSVHVHLNPLRKKLASDPWTYPFSSAGAYGPAAREIPGVETARVLALAGGREAYGRLVQESLERPRPAPWREVWRQAVLGGEALRSRVLKSLEGADVREIAGFTEGKEGLSLDDVLAAVAESSGFAPGDLLKGKFQRVLARKIAIYFARRFTGLTLREIGRSFGVDYTTVHMAARRVEELVASDSGVAGLVASLEEELSGRPPRRLPAAAEPAAKAPRTPARGAVVPVSAAETAVAEAAPAPVPAEAPRPEAVAGPEVSAEAPLPTDSPEEVALPEVPASEPSAVEDPSPPGAQPEASKRSRRRAGRESAQLKLF